MPSRESVDAAELSPWLRRPDESAKAFAAFTVYLNLGVGRTLDKVGERVHPRKPGPHASRKRAATGKIQDWSSQFSWVARAAAYDDHEARIRHEAREKHLRDIAEELTRDRIEFIRDGTKAFRQSLDKARTYLSFPEAATTVRDDGGTKITNVAPIGVLDAKRANEMAARALADAIKAFDRLEELVRPAAKSPEESVTPGQLSGAKLRAIDFHRETQAAIDAIPLEPPDDETTDGPDG